jgi:uncharacterized membrane protein
VDLHLSTYNILKFAHIFLAILAVGFNISYGIWLARAAREPEHQSHVLRGIKFLDDRVANPAYVLLLVTGVLTALVGNLPFTTFWIAAAIVLWVVAVGIGVGFYTPTLRRQIQVLETEGPDSAEFKRLSGRGRLAGIATAVPVVLILLLMVLKPTLG